MNFLYKSEPAARIYINLKINIIVFNSTTHYNYIKVIDINIYLQVI